MFFSTQDLTNSCLYEEQEENNSLKTDIGEMADSNTQYYSTLPKNFRRGVQKKVFNNFLI